MIYYFSATGNSEWVAREIAGDTAVSIPELVRKGVKSIPESEGETLGIVFPVHAWSVPKNVIEFVSLIKADRNAFVFAVCTCGEEAGKALQVLSGKIRLDSGYSIVMPNNYVLYNVDSPEAERRKIENARAEIPGICAAITEKKKEFRYTAGRFPTLKSRIIGPLFAMAPHDKKYRADENCTGCGLCEKICPLGNIRMAGNRPTWNGNCIQCMACINRCPVRAIQYGNATQTTGRYVFR